MLDLPNWIEYERLMNTHAFVAIDRQGSVKNIIETHYPSYIDKFDCIELDLKAASTAFRNDPHRYKDMIDGAVFEYILKHHLYGV